MRITNTMMTNQFLSESNDALNRVSKYQSQVDSTKRLRGIADDPQSTLTAMKARNKLSNLALYKTNISTANGYLKEASSAATELNAVIQSAYDDIIDAKNGSKTADELKILAEDIKNLRDEVLAISNASLGTSYIFSGYNYTGKTSGTTKTPPFSVNGTGDLIYNGVNLSQLSWKDEFNGSVNRMSDPDPLVTNDLEDTILNIATSFTTSYADDYAMNQSKQALKSLNELVSNGEAALQSAREYGIDAASANYQAMSEFLYGSTDTSTVPSTHIPGIADIATALNNETSKEMAVAGVVYTPEQQDNLFSKAKVLDILQSTTVPSAFSMLTGDVGSQMNSAIRPLQQEIENDWATKQPALDDEIGKTTKLQIGTAQNVDMTFTGIDLLGSGIDNIYHILDKSAKMLSGEINSDQLSNMITTLQNAQSNVLTLGTKIGATQNRLTFTSNRYEASELNYTEMKSNAEDADMAESIVNLTTAQTVYNAALAGGAEILKTSLIDFLR